MKIKVNLLIGLSILKIALFSILTIWLIVILNTTLKVDKATERDAVTYMIFIIVSIGLSFIIFVIWIANMIISYKINNNKNDLLLSVISIIGIVTLLQGLKYKKTTK